MKAGRAQETGEGRWGEDSGPRRCRDEPSRGPTGEGQYRPMSVSEAI